MKRFLAILLAMTLLMTLLPLPALATTGGGDGGPDIPVDPPAAEDPPLAVPELAIPQDVRWDADMSPWWQPNPDNYGMEWMYTVQYRLVTDEEQSVNDYDAEASWFPEDWAGTPVDMLEKYGSGSYQFRVRAHAEDTSIAGSSAWSDWSDHFNYIEPDERLEVTDLQWSDDGELTWQCSGPARAYEVRCQVVDAGQEPDWSEGTYTYETVYGESWELEAETMESMGSGTWYACVRAVPADVTQYRCSQWTQAAVWDYILPQTQLDAPADLTWHLEYDSEDKETPWMGSMAFTRSVPDQYRYEVAILEDGEEISSCTWRVYEGSTATRFSVDDFVLNDLPSGTYSFAVRALGDYSAYRNSSWTYSEEWTYTRPAGQLDAPTGPVWEERDEDVLLKWNAVDGVKYYQVEILWAETPDGQLEFVTEWIGITATEEALTDWELEMYGDGWYFFRVRAVSGDITQICNSDYSEMSQGFYMGDVTNAVNGQLEAVDTSGSAADIRDSVAAIDHLDEALAADTGNNGTAKLIEELDTTVGTTTVETEDITDFDEDAVQIYGAALNNAGDATLTIGQPRQGETAPELQASQYRNTLQFSMDIDAPDADAATGGHQLAIPVKLVLPVPETINPAFLVILHHKQSDNSWEVIHPHVYQQDGKWYAAFVTDSFSDFAMANGVEITRQEEQSALRVELTASIDGTTLLCALYDSNDRMLDTAFLTREQTEGTLTFGAAEPSYVRIFALDSENRPVIPFEIVGLFEK